MGKTLWCNWHEWHRPQRWLAGGLAFLMLGLLYVGVLVLFVDPRPVGEQQLVLGLEPLALDSYSQKEVWLEPVIPAAEYTARLTAAHAGGERDVRYGLALGAPDEFVEITVSPLGYAAVYQVLAGERMALRPLAPFPHVRGGEAVNEFWLTVQDGQLIVRLNREIFWIGDPPSARPQLMLVAESYAESARINFQQLALFYDTSKSAESCTQPLCSITITSHRESQPVSQ